MSITKFNFSAVALLIFSFYVVSGFAQNALVPNKISLRDGREFSLNLPANYEIIPAAEGLNRVRFFAVAPDGRIFVADMFSMDDNKNGTVYILDAWNARKGKIRQSRAVYEKSAKSEQRRVLHRQKRSGLALSGGNQSTDAPQYVKNSVTRPPKSPKCWRLFPITVWVTNTEAGI